MIEARLKGVAQVYTTDELLAAGIFGKDKGPAEVLAKFKTKFGNLVVLPEVHEQVYWFEEGKFGCEFKGHHGGLSVEEMEIPFIAWR